MSEPGAIATGSILNIEWADPLVAPGFTKAAILVSILFIISAIAMLRQWTSVRRLVVITGVLSILLHVYGALPPHRNMGYLALLIGAGYAVVMMLVYQWNTRQNQLA